MATKESFFDCHGGDQLRSSFGMNGDEKIKTKNNRTRIARFNPCVAMSLPPI